MLMFPRKFKSIFVGDDKFGNRYYEEKRAFDGVKKRRWVYYKGVPEASKVTPEWHPWLHYTTDIIPDKNLQCPKWSVAHQPNLTGTSYAYYPEGHILNKALPSSVIGDYEAWKPE